MSLPEKICMLPWISIETSPQGTARPCCLAKDEITRADGSKYTLKENTLEEIYHSEYMQNLRKEFLAGNKPATCQRCWDEEASGRTSKRINSRVRLKEYYDNVDWSNTDPDQLWFIDLKLGNICNLKCRICGSWSSSKWAQEEIQYEVKKFADLGVHDYDKKKHLAYTFLQQGRWPRQSNEFWDNLRTLLPNIKYLEFTGGEPFLIEQHFELLRYAVETGDSQHIEIHYNTNGTQFPDAAELWNKFKHVEIALSIDNTGVRFEYERYGAKWNEVQENINKFSALRSNKISMQLCTTINIQNVYYLPEICEWIETQTFDHVFFNMLHDPWQMSISKLTAKAKKLVVDRLKSHNFSPKVKTEILRIIKFIENGSGGDGRKFLQKMKITDEHRKQSFLDTHEEIARAMGYED